MSDKPFIISFDLDDTLYDNGPVIVYAFKALYQHLIETYSGFESFFSFEAFVTHARDIHQAHPRVFDFSLVRKLHIESALQQSNHNNADIEAAYEVFLTARQEVTLFEDTIPVLSALKKNYQLISVSNGNAYPSRIGLTGYFTHSFNPTICGFAKPDPDMYREVCRMIDIEPSQLIHIGDCLQNDYYAAIEAGCNAIWFNNKNATSDIKHQVSNLKELIIQIPTIA